jgi:hypothetical protein
MGGRGGQFAVTHAATAPAITGAGLYGSRAGLHVGAGQRGIERQAGRQHKRRLRIAPTSIQFGYEESKVSLPQDYCSRTCNQRRAR